MSKLFNPHVVPFFGETNRVNTKNGQVISLQHIPYRAIALVVFLNRSLIDAFVSPSLSQTMYDTFNANLSPSSTNTLTVLHLILIFWRASKGEAMIGQ